MNRIDPITPAAREKLRNRFALLTERELQIAGALVLGESNKEIGARFAISPKTVASHVRAIFSKTGLRGRAELPRAYYEAFRQV